MKQYKSLDEIFSDKIVVEKPDEATDKSRDEIINYNYNYNQLIPDELPSMSPKPQDKPKYTSSTSGEIDIVRFLFWIIVLAIMFANFTKRNNRVNLHNSDFAKRHERLLQNDINITKRNFSISPKKDSNSTSKNLEVESKELKPSKSEVKDMKNEKL